MSGRTVYLDASAIVKLAVMEEHSSSLRTWLLERPRRASAALSRTEVLRAVRASGPAALGAAREVLAGLYLINLDDRLLDVAGTLDPAVMRSLDAVFHLAAALSLGDDLSEVVSYDARMIDGARSLGLPRVRPT